MARSKLEKGAVGEGYDRWSEIYDHDANPLIALVLQGIEERAPDAALAARLPRAQRCVGWPMLVVPTLRA